MRLVKGNSIILWTYQGGIIPNNISSIPLFERTYLPNLTSNNTTAVIPIQLYSVGVTYLIFQNDGIESAQITYVAPSFTPAVSMIPGIGLLMMFLAFLIFILTMIYYFYIRIILFYFREFKHNQDNANTSNTSNNKRVPAKNINNNSINNLINTYMKLNIPIDLRYTTDINKSSDFNNTLDELLNYVDRKEKEFYYFE